MTGVQRWWKCWIVQKDCSKNFQNYFQAKLQRKENVMLLVTDFATVSQIPKSLSNIIGIMTFCYTWVNKCDVTRLCAFVWMSWILTTHRNISDFIRSSPTERFCIRSWGLPPPKSGPESQSWCFPSLNFLSADLTWLDMHCTSDCLSWILAFTVAKHDTTSTIDAFDFSIFRTCSI